MLRPLIEVSSNYPSNPSYLIRKFWIADGWIEDSGDLAWQYYELVNEARDHLGQSFWISYGRGRSLSDFWGPGTDSQLIFTNGSNPPNDDDVLEQLGFEVVTGTATPAAEPELHLVGSVATQSVLPATGEPMGIYSTRDDLSVIYGFWTNARGDLDGIASWAQGTWDELITLFPNPVFPQLD
ncbi:hypothetical protein TIN2_23 [Tsukamurella phage TIN2]|uniref:Uncharacterized protein n=1 Tax=Tsukamurella phage TIN2 TaxID=1636545 RepID=A0A0K0N5E5_9CAUD|nr:hypothetical protein AVT55_gp100 [Tsukamurella phage TIN2]AKJ71713.1 hypothetical protein TIN2_23 [Tsukamurella phage TIN2]